MTNRRPLVEELRDPDGNVRLYAAHEAAHGDEPGLAAVMLDVALRDKAEVRTGFGLNDDTEFVAEAAAYSLAYRADAEPLIAAAVTDLAYGDEEVARLLRCLGARYEPLRQELAASAEGRLRLRALLAVTDRTAEMTLHFLADPAPQVRAEAIKGAPRSVGAEVLLPFLTDVDWDTRYWAARQIPGRTAGAEPLLAAARVETDPFMLGVQLRGTQHHLGDPRVRSAVVGFLAGPPPVQAEAAQFLSTVADPGVAAAVASRLLVEDELHALLGYRYVMAYVPELRDLLERLLRHPRSDNLAFRLTWTLAKPDGTPATAELDEPQRARLLREVTSWAVAALDAPVLNESTGGGSTGGALPGGASTGGASTGGASTGGASTGGALLEHDTGALRAWLADPLAPVADLDRPGVAGDCLRAAVADDLQAAMDAGVRAAVAAASRRPTEGGVAAASPGTTEGGVAAASPGTTEGGVAAASRGTAEDNAVAAGWAAELTRLAHRLTATQIQTGLEPLPAGPLRHLRLAGEDPRVPVLVVRLSDGSAVPLTLHLEAPAAEAARPEHAVLRVPCPECAVPHRVAGPLTWQYRDDDRYAESEDGFAGALSGPCPVCGTVAHADVMLSLTRSRGDNSVELSWHR